MSKIHEYILLNRKLRAARRELAAAREKITVYTDKYSLDTLENIEVSGCINKFEQVCGTKAHLCDDGGYEKHCPLFADLPCPDRKCPHFAGNLDYTVAQERYDAAVAARRMFLRNFWKGRTK